MDEMYATITSRGQITLPAPARRALGLRAGQRVAVHVKDRSLVLEAPPDIGQLRARIRDEAQDLGTWGVVPVAGDGWNARTEDRRGEH